MPAEKIIPLGGINVDLHESLLPPNVARFIKNLVYEVNDTATATTSKGASTGVFKPCESNTRYIENLVLPAGYNQLIGAFSFRDLRQVFAFVYNSNQNHTLYRINGSDQTFDIVMQGPVLNFQLNPERFIHFGGCTIELSFVTDPLTGQELPRTFLMYTDGFNPPRFIAVEDSIATKGFNPTLFPYFVGNYNPFILINMGVPTPNDCISISEVQITPSSVVLNNALLFNTWQFRLRYYDVWGRPSEYGIISDMYIPGGNDCISSSSGLPRCLDLVFKAPTPQINQVEIAFRNCNSQQWYTSDVLELYTGSYIGSWWLRPRNPKVSYNAVAGTITYQFCADKMCSPVAPTDTNRLNNPLPRTSQSVSQVGQYISLSNNEDGFLPFSQSLRDNIQLVVESPTDPANTANNFRNITVWVEIYNPFLNSNQPIFQQGINSAADLVYGFGAFGTGVQYRAFFAYFQYFLNPAQQGFVGTLAGTQSIAISTQFVQDTTTGILTEVKDFKIKPPPFGTASTNRYYQKFIFSNVPRGQYLFRILSHQCDPATQSISDCIKTSTYTAGTYACNFSNFANPINHAQLLSEAKELVVNVCDADYDTMKDSKILVVWDLDAEDVDIEAGYVYNTSVAGLSQIGVPLLRVDAGAAAKKTNFTDHNGFYFVASQTNRFRFQIFGYCGCNLVQLASGRAGASNKLWIDNFQADPSDCTDYANQPCNFILIKGQVLVCNSVIAVPGVSVVLSRGGSATTDQNGSFIMIAYDDTLNPTRVDNLYYISGGCPFTACDGACVQPLQVTITKCVTCSAREVNVVDLQVLFRTAQGLLSGATYPVGVVGWDWLGRPTFVQPLGNISIPSIQETKIFAPSRVRVNILPAAVFPPETLYITFWIGTPAEIEEYITWIVDKVVFIDNTGKENDTAPTQIKIYYASLVEYNKQNNFNTTVSWQFIPTGQTTPVLSDKVQFLLNGDGTFFSKTIVQLVKYDTIGQFFLIDYTSDLANLKQNAFIRIIRPKQCTTSDVYFEICSTVAIVNRKAQVSSFYLNAFDTYYLNRQIPVPVTTGTETVNELRIFGVPFEHNSPSNFWGQGCHNIGRVNIANPYETVLFNIDQIALSGVLSATGQLNFLNFFDDARKIDFSDTNINGIVSVLDETSTVLVIGQADSFIVGFNDNLVRINQDGTAQAGSIDNSFGQPQRKVGANYGCLLFDKNTIYKHEGMVQWLDTTKAAVIQHNYQTGVPMSQSGADSYIRPKIKEVQDYNLLNGSTRYFVGVINPINNEYLLTDYIIRSDNFINSQRQFNVAVQETVAFDVLSKAFKGSYSFTPEFYSELEGELHDQQLFTFINAIPYSHYSALATKTYNTFYGQTVERVLEVVCVMDNLKKKKPLSLGEYCKQGVYFADQVRTETGQLSRILISQFIEAEYGWYGPFLCDLNTPFDPNVPAQTGSNNLMDGNMLTGTWVAVRLVGDPAINNQYSEFQGIVISVFASEKSGT